MIGLCNRMGLERELVTLLEHRPVHCEHILMNIALLSSESGSASIQGYLLDHLKRLGQLFKQGKGYAAIDWFDQHAIPWGFQALRFMDHLNASDNLGKLVQADVWQSVLRASEALALEKPVHSRSHQQFCTAGQCDEGIQKAMKLALSVQQMA